MKLTRLIALVAGLISMANAGFAQAASTERSSQTNSQPTSQAPAGASTRNRAPSQAGDARPVILAFGDSLTAGYGVPRGQGYPEQLQRRLDAAGYSYRVVNMGRSGDTTRGARGRITRALLLQPAIVILEFGGNDLANRFTADQIRANFEAMLELFGQSILSEGVSEGVSEGQRAETTVVLAQTNSRLSSVFAGLARKYGVPLIPDFLQGVGELTIGDGRHPNAEGYTIVTDTVMQAIEPLLGQPEPRR